MSELKPVYLSLWKRPKPIYGYWYVRLVNDQPRVSIKLPEQRLRSYPQDSPQEAVGTICMSYTEYWQHQLNNIWQMQAELPLREGHRQGFRPGWLNRLRIELERQYQQLLQFLRRDLPDRLLALREGGWPAPATLKVPWEDVDGPTAAGVLWMPEKGFDALDGLASASDRSDSAPTGAPEVAAGGDSQAPASAGAVGKAVHPRTTSTTTRIWGQALDPHSAGGVDGVDARSGGLRGLVPGIWRLTTTSLPAGEADRRAQPEGRSSADQTGEAGADTG